MPIIGTINFVLRATKTGEVEFTWTHIRAFILRLIKNRDPKLSERLHSPGKNMGWGLTPYAVRPLKLFSVERRKLSFYPTAINIEAEHLYNFEVSVFDMDLWRTVVDLILSSKIEKLQLGKAIFAIEKIDIEKSEIKPLKIDRSIDLIFQSPTYLKSDERPNNVLLPLPELIFSSLMKMWLAFFSEEKIENPKRIVEETKTMAKKSVRISALKIRTIRPISIPRNRKLVGFIGHVRMELLCDNIKEKASILGIIEKTNVGGNRSGGFGATIISRIS